MSCVFSFHFLSSPYILCFQTTCAIINTRYRFP
nr:MAG TPA: hypothetical protein [Caudoviricetes sp.]